MPLQKQEIDVQLAQGIETKGDPKKVIPGRLLSLQNGIFVSPGQIKKANGVAPLATDLAAGGVVTAGRSLFNYGEKLLIHDGDNLLAYDEAMEQWGSVSGMTAAYGLSAPGATAVGVSGQPLIRYGLTQCHPDMTIHSAGHTVVAWENSAAGGVFYSVIDTASGVNIVAGRQVANPGAGVLQSPKVISVGNFAIILALAGNSLFYSAVDMADPANGAGVPVQVAADVDSPDRSYDATIMPNGLCLVVYSAIGAVRVGSIDSNLTWTLRTGWFGNSDSCSTIFPHYVTGQYVVAWCDPSTVTTQFVVYGGVNYDQQIVAPTTIEAITSTGITGCVIASNTVCFYYTDPPTNTTLVTQYVVRSRCMLSNGTWLAAASDLCRSVGIAGKAFTYSGAAFIPVVYDSEFQPTMFLLDQSGFVVAKALTDVAAGQPSGPDNITGVNLLPEHNMGATVAAKYAQMEAVSTASSGIRSVVFTFGVKPTGAILGGVLHLGRGVMNMYDGVSMVEHGFHVFPESPFVPNAGGPYVYQYAEVFAWTDSQGNIHRSAPSIPVTQSQNLPIDGASNSVAVGCPTLRITRKPSGYGVQQVGGAPVEIELYRTINGGSVFYRCHAINQTPPLNDPTTDSVSFVDGLTDDQIQSNPQMYTTGGVLENYPANPPLYISAIRNRLWVVDETNPLVLWYSKEVAPGAPVEMSGPGLLTFNLEAKGPANIAVSLDDKVVVLRDNSIGWISGVGPDATGGQNDFTEVTIPSDAGCVDPGSAMTGGVGMVFKSNKGFFLLDRGMNTTYIGADVESFNGQHVTSATILPKTNWCIFTLQGGTALVYDYLFQQWSTLPLVNAVDAVVYRGVYAFLSSDGTVYKETLGSYTADGTMMPLVAETSWLKVGGLSGLQRVYKLILLGEWKSAHKLQVDISVDYNPAVVQSVTFDATTQLVPYQWRLDTLVQQCSAMKIKLTEVASGAPGEGLALSGISFLVGFKPGLARIEAARTKG
jgi:hypothetical protein